MSGVEGLSTNLKFSKTREVFKRRVRAACSTKNPLRRWLQLILTFCILPNIEVGCLMLPFAICLVFHCSSHSISLSLPQYNGIAISTSCFFALKPSLIFCATFTRGCRVSLSSPFQIAMPPGASEGRTFRAPDQPTTTNLWRFLSLITEAVLNSSRYLLMERAAQTGGLAGDYWSYLILEGP